MKYKGVQVYYSDIRIYILTLLNDVNLYVIYLYITISLHIKQYK